MTNKNLYIDIHVLQTVPSANINRDDTGAPKKALYGGVTRARVSSQSWKRAMRLRFNQEDHDDAGLRTKEVPQLLRQALKAAAPALTDEEIAAKADAVFSTAKIKITKDGQTGALMLISTGQLKKLAQYALDNEALDKKELTKLFKGEQSLDLALFGRMVADNPELNVEGSAQVAHAISTHEIVPEFDYFTALDDFKPEDNAGAAMLGTVEYNSSTLYRYANLNFQEFEANIGGRAAVSGALSYIKEFLLSMPNGKQNTFANKTLPNYVMVTLRPDTPVNLVSAFEDPVKSNHGYVEASVKRLEQEYQDALQFVDAPVFTAVVGKTNGEVGEQQANVNGLLDAVGAVLKKAVSDENDLDQAN